MKPIDISLKRGGSYSYVAENEWFGGKLVSIITDYRSQAFGVVVTPNNEFDYIELKKIKAEKYENI